jgi:hypothetical protein
VPSYIKAAFGEATGPAIAELILDGVLEIMYDGEFVCGSDAHAAIYPPSSIVSDALKGSAVSQISIDALKYAQMLDIDEPNVLSMRLYCFQRIPLSPRWQRRLPDGNAVLDYLQVRSGANRAVLDANWISSTPGARSDGWFAWHSQRVRYSPDSADPIFKLYISPLPEQMADVFRIALKVLSDSTCISFKVGNDACGLLRPDKMVAYFGQFEDLAEAAGCLETQLKGCQAHGVPFTAPISAEGLLSWGIDPPQRVQSPLTWLRESWRLWVTNRLATALLVAKHARRSTLEPWQFALQRLRLDGIDTDTWTPSQQIWRRNGSDKEAR